MLRPGGGSDRERPVPRFCLPGLTTRRLTESAVQEPARVFSSALSAEEGCDRTPPAQRIDDIDGRILASGKRSRIRTRASVPLKPL
jgi:hypothetical protein